MRILIETSGGGGIVLVVVIALLASGGGGGISAALGAALIALVVAVVLAVAGTGTYLVYRVRREQRSAALGPPRVLRAEAMPAGSRPALVPPEVRLPADQLAELAEILRRSQRQE